MATPNNPSQNSQTAAPKDNTSNTEAPPAYTPRRVPNLASYISSQIPNFQIQHLSAQPLMQGIPFASAAQLEDEDESEGSSPISLRINSSVSVTRSNNILCLDQSPAENANAIAQAVVKAILEGSSGQCGIPMIDENGVPRPLQIEVDAGIVIEGENNVVGSRQAVTDIVAQRPAPTSTRRRREEMSRDQDEGESQPAKRRRSQ